MSDRNQEAQRLAEEVVSGGIVQKATERLVYQIVEVCAEHERKNTDALRARVAKLEEEVAEQSKEVTNVQWSLRRAGEQEDALRARMAQLEAALSGLVNRLDEIHADSAYKSVWTVNQIHVGPYRGPTYVEALDRARAALKDAPE